ncbi:MAG: PAS domain-containing sensor histidine kinase [Candidatus Bathyarchaeota archaeon]|nr:PAS domain-containing sensor histidine kinase [Candidatus Bathyarchaeota archaeon]
MYKKILNSSQDAVYGIRGTKFVYINQQGAHFLGYKSPQELVGKDAMYSVHPDYRKIVRERTTARQKGENPPNRYEVKLLKKDGTPVDAEFNISTINVEGEKINITYTRDITERIRYRENVHALHRHATELALANDTPTIIKTTLDAMEQTLEFKFASYLQAVDNKLVLHTRNVNINGLELSLNGKGLTVQAANTQKTVLIHDTRKEPNYLKGSIPSLSELDVPVIVDGKTVAVLNVEQNKLNAFNEDHRTLLETLAAHVQTAIYRLDREKEIETIRNRHISDLVTSFQRMSSMVRHDLRSPLQAITNAAHILSENPKDKEMSTIIRNHSNYIDSILDDWRKHTLTGTIEATEANIPQIFNVSVQSTSLPDNINVNLSVDEDLVFMLDHYSMIRVISNLIKNSVEAMPEGGELELSAVVDDDVLIIKVTDSGEGIQKEVLDQIFTPFFTTKSDGMGLGLAFVRQVVEAHGGKIEVDSKVGKGTSVIIRLPKV